jgi:hypothetical protein
MVPYYPNARPAQKLTYCFKNIYTQSILLAYGLLYFPCDRRKAGFQGLIENEGEACRCYAVKNPRVFPSGAAQKEVANPVMRHGVA